MTRARTAAGFGLAAAAWALLVPVLAGRATPFYSHVSQYISELGARGAVNGPRVSLGGFAPTGLFALGFVVLARRAYPESPRARLGLASLGAVGVAYLVTAVFPCDPGCPGEGSVSQSIHSSFGLVEYLGAITGFLLLARALRGGLGAASALAAGLVVLGLAAMLTPSLANVRGLSQRTAELGSFGWLAYASVRLLRAESR